MAKDVILYLEDDPGLHGCTSRWLREDYPDYNVISGFGFSHVKDEFEKAGGIENLAVACTDGDLVGPAGWEVVKELRKKGWDGPAIYCGLSSMPQEYKPLFVDEKIEDKSSIEISEAIGKYLEKN